MPHRLPNDGEAHLILTFRRNQKLYEVATILHNRELFESFSAEEVISYSAKDLLRRVKEDVL